MKLVVLILFSATFFSGFGAHAYTLEELKVLYKSANQIPDSNEFQVIPQMKVNCFEFDDAEPSVNATRVYIGRTVSASISTIVIDCANVNICGKIFENEISDNDLIVRQSNLSEGRFSEARFRKGDGLVLFSRHIKFWEDSPERRTYGYCDPI